MSMSAACSTSSRRALIAAGRRVDFLPRLRRSALRKATRVETTPFRWHTAPPALALYASSKIIGENLLRLYKQRYGLEYIALRYSTVYGERQHHRGVNALHIIESYERIKAGERPVIAGDGSEAHDYVYVGDVARANVMAMASEVSGESFLIATGVDSSVNDIVAILLKLTGSPLKP